MSTRIIAVIFVVLVIILGLMLFGNSVGAPAPVGTGVSAPVNNVAPAPSTVPTPPPGTHTMPDGTVMMNSDANANMHMMPDGTMMSN